MKICIENADYILTVDRDGKVLTGASLVVEGDRIIDLGPAAEIKARHPKVDRVIRGSGKLVAPGLIDTHLHTPEQLTRGLFPDTISTRPWVYEWAKIAYSAMNEEDEYVSALAACADMIRTGTTCFLDLGALSDLNGIVAAVEESGLRAVVGRYTADTPPENPPSYYTPEFIAHHFFPSSEAALEALEKTVQRWNGAAGGRIRAWVNIEGKEPCSPALHAGSVELARRLGVGCSYHIASSVEEARIFEKKYGRWPVTQMAEIGALAPHVVLAHVVAVQDQEIEILASTGARVAFCPGTSLKLAKGATKVGRYPEMVKAGITVSLGCDGVSAAGSLDLLRQVYLVAGIFKDARMDPGLFPAEQALAMGTIEGAKAMLWDDEIGSLEPGKKADLILFDIDRPEWVPCHEPVNTLVYAADGHSVDTVMVDGRVLMENGTITAFDEKAAMSRARKNAAALAERSGLGAKRRAFGKTSLTY
ncbi:MAG: amidohydrolase [Firmicutes bacterium]|nr:amidohydrolase [Bacillota bacterium]